MRKCAECKSERPIAYELTAYDEDFHLCFCSLKCMNDFIEDARNADFNPGFRVEMKDGASPT